MNTFSVSRICILLFAFLFASVQLTAGNEPKKNGKVKTTHANGVKASEGKVKNYQKNGSWKYWDEKGILVKQATYKNDVLNGLYVEFHSQSQKANEGNYLAGQKNGNWNEWYTDGKLRSQTSYLSGQYNGTQKFWFENGILFEESLYQYGVIVRRKMWFSNGRVHQVENYFSGKRNGEWLLYDENTTDTTPVSVKHYIQDRLNGLSVEYNNGRKIKEANYIVDQLHGKLRTWDKNGNLSSDENYLNGKLHGESLYYNDAKLVKKATYLMGVPDGLFIENNQQGECISRIWYSKGNIDSALTYHSNSKIATRSICMNKSGTYESFEQFNEDGVLILKGNLRKKVKHGVWFKYYDNGTICSEITYRSDTICGVYRCRNQNGRLMIEMQCFDSNVVNPPLVWNVKGKLLKRGDVEYNDIIRDYFPAELIDDPTQYIDITDDPRFLNVDEQEVELIEEADSSKLKLYQGPVFVFAEEMPRFVGGESTLVRYLSENIIYPESARRMEIQGTVYVNFIVRSDGSITDVTVLKAVQGASDISAEAIRVIAAMPKWIPGTMHGKPVDVRMSLPIRFILQ